MESIPKYALEPIFKHLEVAKTIFCQTLFFLNELFETVPRNPPRSGLESLSNASKPDLKCLKSLNFLCPDPEASLLLITGLFFVVVEPQECLRELSFEKL